MIKENGLKENRGYLKTACDGSKQWFNFEIQKAGNIPLMETTCMEGDNELYLVILELRHTWGIFE
jgi:hypothetical protein